MKQGGWLNIWKTLEMMYLIDKSLLRDETDQSWVYRGSVPNPKLNCLGTPNCLPEAPRVYSGDSLPTTRSWVQILEPFLKCPFTPSRFYHLYPTKDTLLCYFEKDPHHYFWTRSSQVFYCECGCRSLYFLFNEGVSGIKGLRVTWIVKTS